MAEQEQRSWSQEELVRACRKMWDGFPHRVLLLARDRTIRAANATALETGVRVGSKCYQLTGSDEIHAVCRANAALRENQPKRNVGPYGERFLDSYWLPIPGEEDLYIHFAIDITKWADPAQMKGSSSSEPAKS